HSLSAFYGCLAQISRAHNLLLTKGLAVEKAPSFRDIRNHGILMVQSPLGQIYAPTVAPHVATTRCHLWPGSGCLSGPERSVATGPGPVTLMCDVRHRIAGE